MKVSNQNDKNRGESNREGNRRGESNPSAGQDEFNRDEAGRSAGSDIGGEEELIGRDDEITSPDEGFIASDEEYNRSYETRSDLRSDEARGDDNKMGNKLKGKWEQYVGAAKTAWGKLTRDELLETEGEEQRLTALIQERYGIDREAARQQVRNFIDKY
jgi:uncharacterized protein YjbJ (UPF0337 family)